MECRVIIDFRGKSYLDSIPYVPSKALESIPPHIIKGMSQQNPIRLKSLMEKAGSKRLKQKEYILNQLTGRLGERIVRDFLTERGFKIRPRFNPGDFSGELRDKEYIIEVKTFRGEKRGVRLKRKQVKDIKALANKQGKKALFYCALLYALKVSTYKPPEILKDDVEVYEYRVQVIRPINQFIKGRLIGNKEFEIPRNCLFSNFKSMKYPYYFFF